MPVQNMPVTCLMMHSNVTGPLKQARYRPVNSKYQKSKNKWKIFIFDIYISQEECSKHLLLPIGPRQSFLGQFSLVFCYAAGFEEVTMQPQKLLLNLT